MESFHDAIRLRMPSFHSRVIDVIVSVTATAG